MGDRIIALAVLALAGLYFYGISKIRVPSIVDALGPRTFPTMIGVGLVFAACLLFLETRSASRRSAPKPAPKAGDDAEPPPQVGILAGVVVVTAVYFAAFEPVGYLLATSIYLLALTAYFNPRNRFVAASSSIGFACLTYFAFKELLGVRLPGGLLPL